MKHEKALYNHLSFGNGYADTRFDVFYSHEKDSFTVQGQGYCFEVCRRMDQDGQNGIHHEFFFDDRSDQGFDPITAREALRLLKGWEA